MTEHDDRQLDLEDYLRSLDPPDPLKWKEARRLFRGVNVCSPAIIGMYQTSRVGDNYVAEISRGDALAPWGVIYGVTIMTRESETTELSEPFSKYDEVIDYLTGLGFDMDNPIEYQRSY